MKWLFIRSSPKCWSWRKLAVNGSALSESPEFADFGACVHDAIRNGLDARKDDWVVSDAHATTHFAPTGAPLILPKSGTATAPATDPRAGADEPG